MTVSSNVSLVSSNDVFGPVVKAFAPVRPAVADVLAAFKAIPGTNRHACLTILARNFGKAIPRAKLLAVWGDANDLTNVGALGMCLEGGRKSIVKFNLPFRIVKSNATIALVSAN